jgi:hypothetical protein
VIFLPFLVCTAGGVLIGLFIALIGMLTGSPGGRFTWPPKLPARYPAPPQHRAPKGFREVTGDVLAWLREDERAPARHGGGS